MSHATIRRLTSWGSLVIAVPHAGLVALELPRGDMGSLALAWLTALVIGVGWAQVGIFIRWWLED